MPPGRDRGAFDYRSTRPEPLSQASITTTTSTTTTATVPEPPVEDDEIKELRKSVRQL